MFADVGGLRRVRISLAGLASCRPLQCLDFVETTLRMAKTLRTVVGMIRMSIIIIDLALLEWCCQNLAQTQCQVLSHMNIRIERGNNTRLWTAWIALLASELVKVLPMLRILPNESLHNYPTAPTKTHIITRL